MPLLGTDGSLFFSSSWKDSLKGRRIQLSLKTGPRNQASEEVAGAPACESELLAEEELDEAEEVGEVEDEQNEKRKNTEVAGNELTYGEEGEGQLLEEEEEMEDGQSGGEERVKERCCVDKDEALEKMNHRGRHEGDEVLEGSAEKQNDEVRVGAAAKSSEESEIEDEVMENSFSSEKEEEELDENGDATERSVSDEELNEERGVKFLKGRGEDEEGESDEAEQKCSRGHKKPTGSHEGTSDGRVKGGDGETRKEGVEKGDEAGSPNPPGAASDEEVLELFDLGSTKVQRAKLRYKNRESLGDQMENEINASHPAEVGFGVASVSPPSPTSNLVIKQVHVAVRVQLQCLRGCDLLSGCLHVV